MFESIFDFFEECVEDFFYAFRYHSSELRWCEFQYAKSNYIVEFWNTLTSFFITLVGLYGLFKSNKNTKIFYVLLAFIGIASAYFHATLSFAGQLLDELGITIIMLMANYTVYVGDRIGFYLLVIFGCIQLIIQFTYSEYNRFVLFLYALMFVNKFWLALTSKDTKTRWYSHISVGLFFASVLCWVCDFYICGRDTLFNFHGMWHIFIALTAYFTIETCQIVKTKNLPLYGNIRQTCWYDYYEN